ncbi:MAG TPA: hypothetical protein VK741_10445 [Acetobacteraceae bacterium]|nr:hypothetical protein [Acetobacteraceae bacterium]
MTKLVSCCPVSGSSVSVNVPPGTKPSFQGWPSDGAAKASAASMRRRAHAATSSVSSASAGRFALERDQGGPAEECIGREPRHFGDEFQLDLERRADRFAHFQQDRDQGGIRKPTHHHLYDGPVAQHSGFRHGRLPSGPRAAAARHGSIQL